MSCRARRLGTPPFRYRLRGDISPLDLFKPSPQGEGAPVRTLGRMRGQSEKQASLEALCRGGVLTARPAFPNFTGEFRRLRAASYFAHGGKVTKTPPGTLPMDYGSAMLRLGP